MKPTSLCSAFYKLTWHESRSAPTRCPVYVFKKTVLNFQTLSVAFGTSPVYMLVERCVSTMDEYCIAATTFTLVHRLLTVEAKSSCDASDCADVSGDPLPPRHPYPRPKMGRRSWSWCSVARVPRGGRREDNGKTERHLVTRARAAVRIR